MFRVVLLISMAGLTVFPSVAQERRQLDAHVHGKSALNIAIEGKVVQMELEAPGADIVGFEYQAKSADDLASVETAKVKLVEGDALFTLPAGAGCAIEAASVELVADTEPHSEGFQKDHAHSEGAAKKDPEAGGSHTEFVARYRYGCADPDAIDAIAFPFFTTFPKAQELVVQMITRAGSARYKADRDNPSIIMRTR
jgi:hypothetical protein